MIVSFTYSVIATSKKSVYGWGWEPLTPNLTEVTVKYIGTFYELMCRPPIMIFVQIWTISWKKQQKEIQNLGDRTTYSQELGKLKSLEIVLWSIELLFLWYKWQHQDWVGRCWDEGQYPLSKEVSQIVSWTKWTKSIYLSTKWSLDQDLEFSWIGVRFSQVLLVNLNNSTKLSNIFQESLKIVWKILPHK